MNSFDILFQIRYKKIKYLVWDKTSFTFKTAESELSWYMFHDTFFYI